MSNLCINLFGKLKIQHNDQRVIELNSRAERRSCFVICSFTGIANTSAKKLASMMWGDNSTERAKKVSTSNALAASIGVHHTLSVRKDFVGRQQLDQHQSANKFLAGCGRLRPRVRLCREDPRLSARPATSPANAGRG